MNFKLKAQVFTFFLFNLYSLVAQRPEQIYLEGHLNSTSSKLRSQGCPGTEAGTFKLTRNPANLSPNIRYLCHGDELSIIHNRDARFSGDPKPLTTPGTGYVFYDCKPTIDGPNLATVVNDPCMNKKSPIIINGIPVTQTQGMWLFKGDANGDVRFDQFRNDGYLQNTYNNGKPVKFWFAPITLDQFTLDNKPQFETDVNGVPGPCIDVNTDSAFSVVYLNEVQVSNITGRNGGSGNYTGTMTITGGLPEYDRSNYPTVHIENLFDPNKIGRLTNAPALHGKPMTFTVPEPGRYRITVEDGTGCAHTQRYLVTVAADSGLVKLNCRDAQVGATVCIPITIGKMKELAAGQFTFLFNPQAFEYVRAQNLSPILNSDLSQTVFDNQKNVGIIKFLWFDLNLLPKDFTAESVLVEFCFNVKGPPGPHEFRITGSPVTLEFADIGGNPYPLGEGNGSVFKCNSMISPGSNLDAYFSQCGQTMFINIFGGTGPYTVKWEQQGNSANVVFNRFDQAGLQDTLMNNQPPGIYFISVTDSLGVNIKDTITQIAGLVNLSLNLDLRESASCKNNDGRIFVSANGGTRDYRYQWSNGSVSDRITQLNAGSYFLTVTDAQGCSLTDSVTISQVNTTAAISIQRNPTCSGISDGRILPDFARISGIPPFSIEWQGDGVQIGNSFAGLGTNPSRLIVTDFKGCSDTAFISLNPAKRIELQHVIDNPTCFGRNDGRLEIGRRFSDGSLMVNDTVFLADPLGIPFPPNNSVPARFNNIVSGVYTVRITDRSGCFLDTALTLTQPSLLDTALILVSPETCFPGNDASITIRMRGGTAPYRYTWNDTTLDTDTRSGLSDGNYQVTISDANNCVANFNASNLLTINFNLPSIPVSIDTTAILCNGQGARLTARPAPGFSIARYKWSNGDTTVIAQNVLANIPAWVEVTDTLGCKGSDTVILSQPLAISVIDSQLIEPVCPGDRFFGRISYTAAGGTGPYTYSLAGGPSQTFGVFPNLRAGNYTVSITDANNCPGLIINATLREPPRIAAAFDTVAFRPTKCATPDDCSGQARILVSGGTDPNNNFLILWESGEQTNNQVVSIADSLCAGTQTVQIIDGNGCSITETFSISSPDSISRDVVRTAVQDITCFNQNNGSINYIAFGGTSPFTYLWSDNSTQNNLTNLTAGRYTVTVTDLNNCAFIDSIRIIEPPELLVSLDSVRTKAITCPGSADGQLGVLTIGGNAGDLAFSWSASLGDTNFIRNVVPGIYQVVVTDIKGCRDTLSNIIVSDPPPLALNINATYSPVCAGDTIGVLITGVSGGNGASYSYSVNNGNSIPIANRIGLKAGNYQLSVFDRKGCALDTTFQVIDPVRFTVDLGPDRTIRLGDSLRVTTASNHPISRIDWKNIEGINCISPDCSILSLHPTKNTIFQATAYDASGCIAFDQIAIAVDLRRAVFIPNAFRPDQLSANQEFKFFAGSGVVAIHSGKIFNRWGDLMSEVQNLSPDPGGVVIWDGRFNGTEVESGVYVYVIEVEFTDGARLLYKGDVTLLR